MKKYIISLGLILLCLVVAFVSWEKYRNEMQAFALHMLGNNAYNSSQEQKEEKKKYLEEALTYYSGSLSLRENEDTRYNYELVEELLQDLEEQSDENKSKDGEKKEEKNGEGKSQGDTKNSEEQKGNEQESTEGTSGNSENKNAQGKPEDTQEKNMQGDSEGGQGAGDNSKNPAGKDQKGSVSGGKRGEEYFLQESQKIENLTKQEEEALKKITQQLKQEQVYNQKYFGKKQQKQDFNNLIDSFFGTIDRGGEKDW